MNSFTNLKISTRLSWSFGLMLVIVLGIVAAAMFKMSSMRALGEDIATNWIPSMRLVNDMDTALSNFRVEELRHVMASSEAEMADSDKKAGALQASIGQDNTAYLKLISSPEEKALHDGFERARASLNEVHGRIIDLSRKNQKDAARKLLEGESVQHFDAASKALDQLVALNRDGAMTATKNSDAAYRSARLTMIAASVLATVLVVFGSLVLSRSISRPMDHALQAASRIADGDLTTRVEHNGSKDETGELLATLQRMQRNLANTVSAVRSNAEGVATASVQVSQGNNDLSQRTEEQASALQQTAATMEELGTTVHHNSANADQAHRLAQGASQIASQGSDIVAEVVGTMKEIHESSRKISDIISMIDGIAFQTNILALNAAVEAARAGEQGRGFAVVASEVRGLAQRSAEAAKEIKTLISRSVEQVEQGATLVDRAGRTMTEIVDAVKGVSGVVSEISSATREQSTGVAQVGQAVSQMDQSTQQNAALVEQSAAAAESLKAQAQQLVSAVSVFKVAR